MKNIIIAIAVCCLLFSASHDALAKTETNVNIHYVSSSELSIVSGTPAAGNLAGFTLSCDFTYDSRISDNQKFITLEFGSASATGGSRSSYSMSFTSGYGISKNVFITFEYMSASSANIHFDVLLAGAKISQSYLNDRLFLDSYFSFSLLGFTTYESIPLIGHTLISKFGAKFGYRVSDNFIIDCGGKIADMAYFDTSGAINIRNISLSLGVSLPF